MKSIIGLFVMQILIISGVANASSFTDVTLKGKYRNGYCSYSGLVNVENFPRYDLYSKSMSKDGNTEYQKISNQFSSKIIANENGTYSISFGTTYRIVGPFCRDYEVVVHVD